VLDVLVGESLDDVASLPRSTICGGGSADLIASSFSSDSTKKTSEAAIHRSVGASAQQRNPIE
jgi:hypothetical protein